jgi:4'-phosphopantetheinyl transferase
VKVQVTDAIVYYRSLAGLAYAEFAARWLQALPTPKRRAIERVPQTAAQATLAGIDLLAHCANALGHPEFDAGALVYPERGKPRWPGGLEFNISHTREYAVCVATRGLKVGVDIEDIEGVRPEILRRVASAEERERYGATTLGAARLWTRKEAALKAAGRSVFDAAAVLVQESYADCYGQRWYYSGPERLEGCALALAFERPGVLVDLRRATRLA